MTQKLNIRLLLLTGLVTVSSGGLLLHLRIHSPAAAAQNLIPFITSMISVLVIPVMFIIKKTRAYAYVVNGMIVIIGIITMAHFSLSRLSEPLTVKTLLFGTLFGSCVTLLTNFFVGKALFELEMFKVIDASIRHGRFWRYPNMGWWGVHLITLTTAFTLGSMLWK